LFECNRLFHMCRKLRKDGTFRPTKSADLRVGDIIKVYQNDRVPADMVLLQTTEKAGSVFIRTDQLDGETDWKLRKAVTITQSVQPPARLIQTDGEIAANPPNDQIYDFKGYFESKELGKVRGKKPASGAAGSAGAEVLDEGLIADDAQAGEAQRESLSLENTLWANTVLASSGYVLGMIVYTGVETRAQMNAKDAVTKVGKLDLEINKLAKLLFVFMLVVSFGIVALSGFRGNVAINFFRFVLLLSAVIPISLRVNLDLGKVYYCLEIYADQDIPGTIPRNSTIPEELGRIQFLLTDKTGTLTKNDMIFKKLNMEFAAFETDSMPDLKAMLVDNCSQRSDAGPMADLVGKTDEMVTDRAVSAAKGGKGKKKGGLRRDQSCVVRDLVTALALCHNVTPTFPNPEKPKLVEY